MNKNTLIPLGISIVLVLAAAIAYYITFGAVSKLQEESFLLQEEIAASLDKEARISRAERTLQSISSQESVIYGYLVSDETVVDFLEILEGIEEQTNVAIEIVSVAAGESGDFNINLTVEGQFKNVIQTLGAIETLPAFITIEKGTIETIVREGDSDDGVWTASAAYSVREK